MSTILFVVAIWAFNKYKLGTIHKGRSLNLWGFQPPPFVRILDRSIVLNSRNLLTMSAFEPTPPPLADVLYGWNLMEFQQLY